MALEDFAGQEEGDLSFQKGSYPIKPGIKKKQKKNAVNALRFLNFISVVSKGDTDEVIQNQLYSIRICPWNFNHSVTSFKFSFQKSEKKTFAQT